jgi:predicted permease
MGAAPRSTVQTLFQRRRFESGMDEEMRLHLDLYTEDLIRSGVDPAEARRRARMEFGSVDNAKTDCREARGLRPFDELGQNVRHALRRLRKAPGFTGTALATLALCLGANLALFAVVDTVLLRPLPFPEGDRLVSVYNTYPKAGVPNDGCSLPNYYERRGQLPGFAGIAAYREGTATVGPAGATEQADVARVTPDFFSTLGLGPALGRVFTEAETDGRNDDVAIVTDGYWRLRLHGDPAVLGKKVRVDGLEKTVVGVLPPSFTFLSSRAQVYLPLSSDLEARSPRQRHSGTSRMVGRLRPGISLAEAQAQVDARNAALAPTDPDAARMGEAGFRSRVVSLRADHVAAVRPALLLVQAGALFLLLIGAVNLVNLLLIRASGRLKELAVRQALGANRRQVVSEVMVETSVLTLLGGLLGLGVGAAGIRLLGALGADRLPLGAHVALDARVARFFMTMRQCAGCLPIAPTLPPKTSPGPWWAGSASMGGTTPGAGRVIRMPSSSRR